MRIDTALLARVAPFCVYMSFILVTEGLGWIAPGLLTPKVNACLYPVKAGLTAIALLIFMRSYGDLILEDLKDVRTTLKTTGIGLAVYVLWVNLDMPLATMGEPSSYDPTIFQSTAVQAGIIATRMAGAILVVPIMEELFWRSFLSRYLLDKDFMSIRPGRFTLFTFAATTVLFGLEHHLWMAGMIAGAAYNLVYMRTRKLAHCVLCHAVTNAALAVHVLVTGHWHFW